MEWLDWLMRGGPWSLLIVAGLVIRFLFVEMRRRDLEHAAQLQALNSAHADKTQALNDRIVGAFEKQIPLLQAQNDQSRQLVRALTSLNGGTKEVR